VPEKISWTDRVRNKEVPVLQSQGGKKYPKKKKKRRKKDQQDWLYLA
jgi:hypothetical protein